MTMKYKDVFAKNERNSKDVCASDDKEEQGCVFIRCRWIARKCLHISNGCNRYSSKLLQGWTWFGSGLIENDLWKHWLKREWDQLSKQLLASECDRFECFRTHQALTVKDCDRFEWFRTLQALTYQEVWSFWVLQGTLGSLQAASQDLESSSVLHLGNRR